MPYMTGLANFDWGLPEKPIEHIDTPLLAYRAFYVRLSGRAWDVTGHLVAKDARLSAINMQFGDWHPGVNLAKHWEDQPHVPWSVATLPYGYQVARVDHLAPFKGCMCGFWALHDYHHALGKVRWPNDLTPSGFTHIPVVGVIQGWGKVQEHEDGYRFQYASVIALQLIRPTSVPYPQRSFHVTGVAEDFAEETVRRICRQFDVPFCNSYEELYHYVRGNPR